MGQKVSPISFRLVINKDWRSKWFGQKNYREFLLEDLGLRKAIVKKLGRTAGINLIEIQRDAQQIIINIHTARPGIIIGRSGQGINELSEYLTQSLQKTKSNWSFSIRSSQINKSGKSPNNKIKINIIEVRNPEIQANLVAQNIAQQLEKRVAYRRTVKMAIEKVMQNKEVKGVKVGVAGRLGGVEIARKEKFSQGSIPLATLRSEIDYAHQDAFTTYGVIGVKVWIYKRQRGV